MLVKTDFNSVIGGYCPDQWEDTSDKKCSDGYSGKDIVSGKPFLFYWLNDQIQIIKHTDDLIPFMKSDKDWLVVFGGGLTIFADKNKKSIARAWNNYFVHP